ncbi:MAG TPA: hypothetical protein VIM41_12485 [Gammaproteobacteria bacterium]
MKSLTKILMVFGTIVFILNMLLAGCASRAIDDEEGGISGTGNAINCADEKYRKHKSCSQN